MKMYVGILALLIVVISFAQSSTPFSKDAQGIMYVSPDKQNLPKDFIAEMKDNDFQMKRKGYIYLKDDRVSYLLNLYKSAQQEIDKNRVANKFDTHLKAKFDDIELSVPLADFQSVNYQSYAYAAIGAYVNKPDVKGWTGYRGFFNSKVGQCSIANMKIIAVQLRPDSKKMLINRKPSTQISEGNPKFGYIHTVTWYTQTKRALYMHTLECANTNFSRDDLSSVTAIAKELDKVIFNPRLSK